MPRARPAIVVAIPARDEAERIGPCLAALHAQQERPDAVVLLLNNCSDDTEAIARQAAPALGFDLHIAPCQLPPEQANAGHARRLAMALAARWAGPGGVLLTTDADATVAPDWIRRNLAGLLQGADLVCGCAVVQPQEAELIPAHLHADDALERRLIGLVDQMGWLVDPDPHDPPPRHVEASGASLAVWVAAFERVGGIPAVASGEDRAFVDALRQIDARIRHDPAIEVIVSGRIAGRAEGGMADAIRRRMVRQDEFTDDGVEPAADALRRLMLRVRARLAWIASAENRARGDNALGDLGENGLAAELAVDPAWLIETLAGRYFGAGWAAIEARSPVLRRRAVRFVDLPAEIAVAARLVAGLMPPQRMPTERMPAERMATERLLPESLPDKMLVPETITPGLMAAD